MMKVIAIIPARGGSKGLPGKNLADFHGKPLISWPIIAALKSKVIDEVVVTTDSPQIADAALIAGATVPFLRSSTLSGDLATTEETLRDALEKAEYFFNTTFDICVFLTCTDIFRRLEWIREAVNQLRENQELDSVFVGNATHKNYWKRNPTGGYTRILDSMKDYSSRQIREVIIREDTGLACASRAHFWRNGKRIGDNVAIIENQFSETSIDIHEPLDLFIAQKTLDYLIEFHPERVELFLNE